MSAVATANVLPQCVWDAGAILGEGACWSQRHQALYWVDILAQRLYRYAPASGQRTQWQFDDTISAVAERLEYPGLAVLLRRGMALFDPATGTIQYRQEPEPERTDNRFNDGKCDAQGRFWGGSMHFAGQLPSGAIYCFDEQGVGERVIDLGWRVVNGPTWSRDGRTMYLNDTVARRVIAYDFDSYRGLLSNARTWLQFESNDGYPDGMTTDAAGHIWIAHWGAACVTCHEPKSGRELRRIALPTSHITSIAFGGADLKTLFITSARTELSDAQIAAEPLAGGLFAIHTDCVGLSANLFAG